VRWVVSASNAGAGAPIRGGQSGEAASVMVTPCRPGIRPGRALLPIYRHFATQRQATRGLLLSDRRRDPLLANDVPGPPWFRTAVPDPPPGHRSPLARKTRRELSLPVSWPWPDAFPAAIQKASWRCHKVIPPGRRRIRL